jgi:hypothetical protein
MRRWRGRVQRVSAQQVSRCVGTHMVFRVYVRSILQKRRAGRPVAPQCGVVQRRTAFLRARPKPQCAQRQRPGRVSASHQSAACATAGGPSREAGKRAPGVHFHDGAFTMLGTHVVCRVGVRSILQKHRAGGCAAVACGIM